MTQNETGVQHKPNVFQPMAGITLFVGSTVYWALACAKVMRNSLIHPSALIHKPLLKVSNNLFPTMNYIFIENHE